jgi:hypothetical protein
MASKLMIVMVNTDPKNGPELGAPFFQATVAAAWRAPAWAPIDDHFQTDNALAPVTAPPRCLAEILGCAAALGAACGTFVRVDCFATPSGCLFGEFSTTPNSCSGFTPYADAYLGDLWQRLVPERS